MVDYTQKEHDKLFCWCGVLRPCKRHMGKEKPIKLVKIGNYSGDSKWRQEMGQFQAKWGR